MQMSESSPCQSGFEAKLTEWVERGTERDRTSLWRGGECESRVVNPELRFISRRWIGEGGCGISHHNMWGFGRARPGSGGGENTFTENTDAKGDAGCRTGVSRPMCDLALKPNQGSKS